MNKHFTEEQMQILRGSLRGHSFETMITIALVTGVRRDELLHLKWQEIDLEQHEMYVWDSKRKSHHQLIHLPEEITKMLKQHRHQVEMRVEDNRDEIQLDLVFPGDEGEMLQPHSLLKGWYELLEDVGLPRLRFHDLRKIRWQAQQHAQLHDI